MQPLLDRLIASIDRHSRGRLQLPRAAFLLYFFFFSPRRSVSPVDSSLIPTSDWLNLTFINIDILPQSFLPRALVPSAVSLRLSLSLFPLLSHSSSLPLSLSLGLLFFLLLSVVPRDSSFIQLHDLLENFIDLIKITRTSKISFAAIFCRDIRNFSDTIKIKTHMINLFLQAYIYIYIHFFLSKEGHKSFFA